MPELSRKREHLIREAAELYREIRDKIQLKGFPVSVFIGFDKDVIGFLFDEFLKHGVVIRPTGHTDAKYGVFAECIPKEDYKPTSPLAEFCKERADFYRGRM